MSQWQILIERGCDAAAHMAHDVRLGMAALPTLRLFVWDPPAISLGYRQKLPRWFDEASWRSVGLELIERPTGGGMAFHGSDLSLSVIVPTTARLPLNVLMRTVCESAARLCETVGVNAEVTLETAGHRRLAYCLLEDSPYAVFVHGKKVAGFALRRLSRSWLIQGSVLVRPFPTRLAQAIPGDVRQQLGRRAIALADAAGSPVSEVTLAHRLAEAWVSWSHALTPCRTAALLGPRAETSPVATR